MYGYGCSVMLRVCSALGFVWAVDGDEDVCEAVGGRCRAVGGSVQGLGGWRELEGDRSELVLPPSVAAEAA